VLIESDTFDSGAFKRRKRGMRNRSMFEPGRLSIDLSERGKEQRRIIAAEAGRVFFGRRETLLGVNISAVLVFNTPCDCSTLGMLGLRLSGSAPPTRSPANLSPSRIAVFR